MAERTPRWQSLRVGFDPDFTTRVGDRTELLAPAEMAQADALAAASGIAGRSLMANAGRAVARAVAARFRPRRTLVLCGPGNNGGDGYIAARLLQSAGWPVAIAALDPPRPASDAAWAAQGWSGPMTAFDSASVKRADLVIDAVFGAGLARDVEGMARSVLSAARDLVAIDTPSGLDGETGAIRGFAPKALLTVTFFRLKPGHVLLPGRLLCGETVLAAIGLPDSVLARIAPQRALNNPGLWQLPELSAGGHKYSRGHVSIVGGETMTGAARLAAEGARRGGAGLVTIAASPSAAPVYRTGAPGVIVSDTPLSLLMADERLLVWVCGPGLGQEAARFALPTLLAARRCVVADADCLTAFSGDPDALHGAAVLTPHSGEFARLFGPPGADRPRAALAAAARTGSVVLLKGADTIVAAPDGRVSINASAPAWLATAGAGDVLAGLVGALLAQGLPPWEAASAAAWLHGRAAWIAGPGMVAEDIAPALAAAFADAVAFSSATRQEAVRP
jgi:hydroxyethylthiazole kinase-like uncharacterized protein yjeF